MQRCMLVTTVVIAAASGGVDGGDGVIIPRFSALSSELPSHPIGPGTLPRFSRSRA